MSYTFIKQQDIDDPAKDLLRVSVDEFYKRFTGMLISIIA